MIRFKLIKLRGNKSQYQVSDEMGISRSTYKNWEIGKIPKYEMILKLSEYFGITTKELTGMNAIINNLPTNLRKLRNSKQMSCRELCDDIMLKMDYDIIHNTLNGYENGNNNPNLNTLIILSDYFGVTIDELVR